MPDFDEMSVEELEELTTSADKAERAGALLEMAIRHDRDSDYFLSVVDAGSARQLFNEVGDTFNEARSGYIEATGLYRKDDNDEALAAVDSALELMNSLLNEVDIAFALRLRSQVLQSLKRRDEAAITLRNAMELFESNDLKSMAGICALDIGEIHGSADRLREALETFEKALELFIAEGDLVGTGRAHDRIASALISMGNFDEAIVHLRESLHTFEFINEESRIAYAQYRLGWTLVSNGEHIEAMPLLEQASQWYKAASRWGDAADVDHQIAHALTSDGQEAKARALYEQVRAVYAGLGNRDQTIIIECNIAESMARTREFDKAVALLRRNLEQSRLIEDDYLIRSISMRLADTLLELNTFDAAEEALTVLEASPIENWGDSHLDKVRNLDVYRKVYEWLGRDDDAERAAQSILDVDSEVGSRWFAGEAYSTLAKAEKRRGNEDEAARLTHHAIAIFVAEGYDNQARELALTILPEKGPRMASALRPEKEVPGVPEPDAVAADGSEAS